jgi:hypothetical protein
MNAFLKTSHTKKTHTHTHTHIIANKMIVPTPPTPYQVEKYEEDKEDEGKKGGRGDYPLPIPQ